MVAVLNIAPMKGMPKLGRLCGGTACKLFLGYIGLAVPSFQARFTPCVEVGWRLSAIHWGKGLATEVAMAFSE
jgi:RimJ/RimL family protein N-acetyltransferase